jgi:hypothetical protein
MAQQQDQTGTILVDHGTDSAYGDSDAESETVSLRSAVYNYIYENGRRYHSYRAGAYWWVLHKSLPVITVFGMVMLNLET